MRLRCFWFGIEGDVRLFKFYFWEFNVFNVVCVYRLFCFEKVFYGVFGELCVRSTMGFFE